MTAFDPMQTSLVDKPTVWSALSYHLLAIRIERVVDDPFCGIHRVVVFVAEMAKAFSDSFEPWSFGLTINACCRCLRH